MTTFDTLASDETIHTTIANLKERNVEGVVVETGAEALSMISTLVPQGASVMNGASTTLEEIGYIQLLKSGTHPWNNLHEAIVHEKDAAKQAELRRQALLSDYYLGSVHALSQTGEYVVASNTASQLPHIVYSSPNLIFVVGAQKITETLPLALQRLEEYVIPLEDVRMKKVYGPQAGTRMSKTLIVRNESPFVGRKVRMIIVKEKLGF